MLQCITNKLLSGTWTRNIRSDSHPENNIFSWVVPCRNTTSLQLSETSPDSLSSQHAFFRLCQKRHCALNARVSLLFFFSTSKWYLEDLKIRIMKDFFDKLCPKTPDNLKFKCAKNKMRSHRAQLSSRTTQTHPSDPLMFSLQLISYWFTVQDDHRVSPISTSITSAWGSRDNISFDSF